jgi:hypothetical protein
MMFSFQKKSDLTVLFILIALLGIGGASFMSPKTRTNPTPPPSNQSVLSVTPGADNGLQLQTFYPPTTPPPPPLPPSVAIPITPPATTPPHSGVLTKLKIQGAHLFNANGQQVVLRGASRWSLEFSCGDGHFNLSDFQAMARWKFTVVRFPLNASRWNGNGCNASQYQALVKQAVRNAETAGLYPVLVGQWDVPNGDPGYNPPLGRWSSHYDKMISDLATIFAADPFVLFVPATEPHDISWNVWKNGDNTYVGMQWMVDTINKLAPGHIIFVNGLQWDKDLRFFTNGNAITGQNIGYEVHPYGYLTQWQNQWTQLHNQGYFIWDGELGKDSSGDTTQAQVTLFETWQTGWAAWACNGSDLFANWNPNNRTALGTLLYTTAINAH